MILIKQYHVKVLFDRLCATSSPAARGQLLRHISYERAVGMLALGGVGVACVRPEVFRDVLLSHPVPWPQLARLVLWCQLGCLVPWSQLEAALLQE